MTTPTIIEKLDWETLQNILNDLVQEVGSQVTRDYEDKRGI